MKEAHVSNGSWNADSKISPFGKKEEVEKKKSSGKVRKRGPKSTSASNPWIHLAVAMRTTARVHHHEQVWSWNVRNLRLILKRRPPPTETSPSSRRPPHNLRPILKRRPPSLLPGRWAKSTRSHITLLGKEALITSFSFTVVIDWNYFKCFWFLSVFLALALTIIIIITTIHNKQEVFLTEIRSLVS